MFKVKEKETGEIYEVYDINKYSICGINYTSFLIYINDSWKWIDADYFEPYISDVIKAKLLKNTYTSLEIMADKIENDRLKRKDEL